MDQRNTIGEILILVAYLVAITVAEVVTVFVQFIPGIACHIAVLVALVVHSALTTKYSNRPLLLSLALVPLVRIISLSMPLGNIPQILWYPIIYGPLLVATVVIMRTLQYNPGQIGLNFKRVPFQLLIALTGIAFGLTEYFILKPEAWTAELTWQVVLFDGLILLVCTGFVEELMFRGVLQRSAVKSMGGWGIIYISLIFAILHMGFLSWIDGAFVFIIALFFGWVVNKTGSLLGVTLAHGLTNIILFLVAPHVF